jgi:hypothetical protein
VYALSLEGILQVGVRVNTLLESFLSVLFALTFLISSADECVIFLGSEFAGSDISLILPECLPAHGSPEDLDRLQAEAGPDLDQSQLLYVIGLRELLLMLVHYLVASEPNAIVVIIKGEYVVNEGLGLRMVLRRVEGLMQHFLHQ